MKKNLFLLCAVLLVSITTLSFYPSLHNDFTNLDDQVMVYENVKIMHLSLENIKTFFTSFHFGLYHPLVLLSYAIEFRLFGLYASAYHTTNLYLHVFNTLLVLWLFFKLTRSAGVSFITAVLFAVHPLHVESVAWISERKDVLYSFFFLGSLISYCYYRERHRNMYFVVMAALFVLSLLSKPMAVTLPLVLILFDYMYDERFERKKLAEKIPLLLISILFSYLTAYGHYTVQKKSVFDLLSLSQNFLAANYNLLFYLYKACAPLKLFCLYPSPIVPGTLVTPGLVYAPIILSLIAAAVIYSLKYTKKVAYGAVFFIVTILPVSNFLPVGLGIPADRYTYIPLIGIFYIAGEGFVRLYRNALPARLARAVLFSLLCLMIGLLSLLTWRQCHVWKDGITLHNDVLQKYEQSAIAHNNRGHAYCVKGDYDRSIPDFNRAIELDPGYVSAYVNRGNAFLNTGNYDRAMADFAKALQLSPARTDAYLSCANAFIKLGELDKAFSYIDKIFKINPLYAPAYCSQGNIYLLQGNRDKALAAYDKALHINPSLPEVYQNRAALKLRDKDYAGAIADYTWIIKFRPDNGLAYVYRGNAYRLEGRLREALLDLDSAIRLNPDYAEAFFNQGNIFGLLKEYDRAIGRFSRAITLRPDWTEAYLNRAVVYLCKKDYDNAWKDVHSIERLHGSVDPAFLADLVAASKPDKQ
jgi:tetratricopeptide (TPR) repeat protein